jgi:hypothetical protein
MRGYSFSHKIDVTARGTSSSPDLVLELADSSQTRHTIVIIEFDYNHERQYKSDYEHPRMTQIMKTTCNEYKAARVLFIRFCQVGKYSSAAKDSKKMKKNAAKRPKTDPSDGPSEGCATDAATAPIDTGAEVLVRYIVMRDWVAAFVHDSLFGGPRTFANRALLYLYYTPGHQIILDGAVNTSQAPHVKTPLTPTPYWGNNSLDPVYYVQVIPLVGDRLEIIGPKFAAFPDICQDLGLAP